VLRAGRSSNGRTTVSGTVYLGSNPSLPAVSINMVVASSATRREGGDTSLWRRLSWFESRAVYPEQNPNLFSKQSELNLISRSTFIFSLISLLRSTNVKMRTRFCETNLRERIRKTSTYSHFALI
jgi:hypothetical protein